MVDCATCGMCILRAPWRIDLVRNGSAWKHWVACSEECAQAFAVASTVRFAERLDADGFTYIISRP